MTMIRLQDTNGIKGTLQEGEFGYDKQGTDRGRVYVGTNTGNVPLAKKSDLVATEITNTPAGAIESTTVQAALNELDTEKAPLASPVLTGIPTAPTAPVNTNTTQVATTEFVNAEIANDAVLKSGSTMTGTLVSKRVVSHGTGWEFNENAFEAREVNEVGGTQASWEYAPAYGFHWGTKAAATLAMHSDGDLYLRGQAYTGEIYRSLTVNTIQSVKNTQGQFVAINSFNTNRDNVSTKTVCWNVQGNDTVGTIKNVGSFIWEPADGNWLNANLRLSLRHSDNEAATTYYFGNDGNFQAKSFTNFGYGGLVENSNSRNHFVQYNPGIATEAIGWLAAAFGDSTGDRVVIGQHSGKAHIGGHTGALDAWANLTVNEGGGNVIVGNGVDNGAKLQVTGGLSHNGLSPTAGSNIDQIFSYNANIQVGTTWTNTGIDSSMLQTGTYTIQMIVNNYVNSGGQYNTYYSGVMTMFNNTNTTTGNDIILHACGHAQNGQTTYLRTLGSVGADGKTYLQISSTIAEVAPSYYMFKLRRII